MKKIQKFLKPPPLSFVLDTGREAWIWIPIMNTPSRVYGDCGRSWRRVARFGAILCTAVLLLMQTRRGIEVQFAGYLLGRIYDGMFQRGLIDWSSIVDLYFSINVLLFGPVFVFACSERVCNPAATRWVKIAVLKRFWASSTTLPVVFLVKLSPTSDSQIYFGTTVVLVFILLSSLAFLASLRHQETQLCVFWMGLVPILLEFFLFGSLACYEHQIWIILQTIGIGLLLGGWLMWWRAVRTDYQCEQIMTNFKAQHGMVIS